MTPENNVYQLGAHERMTVEEALSQASREAGDYESVLIIAIDAETKVMIVRSSAMTREGAAWMARKAELHAHGLLEAGE